MNIETFLAHYQLRENPFGAEEARHDPVFDRLVDAGTTHPDFAKILGRLERPGTAVVFGEKGSGKTAIRLLLGKTIAEHNREHPDRRVLIVPYDDLNPVLDNLLRASKQNAKETLEQFRLEDHQDAILSEAVTRLTNAVLGQSDGDEPVLLPNDLDKHIKRIPRQTRVDLAMLAALYDQPFAGSVVGRWHKLRSKLRLGWRLPLAWVRYLATVMTLVAAGFGVATWLMTQEPMWLPISLGLSIAAAALLWGYWLFRQCKIWWLARQIHRDTPTIRRTITELAQMIAEFRVSDIARQPFPQAADKEHSAGDARYQLTRRLRDVLAELGYAGLIVLVDRVDEPTLISGDAQKMRSLIWPMFDNKFLQQDRIGIKLLLPIELRHLLHRETPAFFQEARLDKQNMIDRLTWSGTTLYDLCSTRLQACRPDEASPMSLTDLFEETVSRDALIDALDQMHQPRDAFKFLYSLIQEHCRLIPQEEPNYKIARLTLDSIRREQSQRVQEFYRGLAPG